MCVRVRVCMRLIVCVDGSRTEGSEWLTEEREERLEQADSGTESADDRYSLPDASCKTFHVTV